ncbi:hypothetical protein CK203_006516 [Vitis vinifera]|uniref:Secreted protein n=1 Tax=Vitis vinifera TaxID=29760 RepID=A0A438KB65_VITVI|nr:hypothetical protein CK203_006516 [Vitis vinifera]
MTTLLLVFFTTTPAVCSHLTRITGCGHPGFRDLLFCMNDVLMFHITSGSYRVLDIDYAYQALTLDDPHMSTCESIVLEARGMGSRSSTGGRRT